MKFPYRYNDHKNDPTQERWYHGNITGDTAAEVLRNRELQDGAFLVRDSRSEPGSYAFAVKNLNTVIHLRAVFQKLHSQNIFSINLPTYKQNVGVKK